MPSPSLVSRLILPLVLGGGGGSIEAAQLTWHKFPLHLILGFPLLMHVYIPCLTPLLQSPSLQKCSCL